MTAEIIGLKIEVNHNLKFDFYSYYSPPSETLSYKLFFDLIKYDSEILLVGDLNSKTPVVGCKSLDSSGRVLNNVLNDSNLTILNDLSPTYFRFASDYEEILDLLLATIQISVNLKSFKVLSEHMMDSDHAPLMCEIGFKGERHVLRNEILLRFNFNKANWLIFRSILFNKASLKYNADLEDYSVNDLNRVICNDILEAANTAIPKHSNNSVKTFARSILELIEKRRLARKNLKKNKNSTQCKLEYNRLTGLIKKAIKNYTEKKWELFLGKLGPYPVSSRVFWKIINQTRSQKSTSAIPNLSLNNLFYKTDSEKADLFSNILENTFKDSRDPKFNASHYEFVKSQVSKINWDE